MSSSAAIDQLEPFAPENEYNVCLICASLRRRSVEPGVAQTFCAHDGMAVDDEYACSKFELAPSSPARSVASAERRPSLVDVPSLGVSSLDLGAGASASAPLSREGAGG